MKKIFAALSIFSILLVPLSLDVLVFPQVSFAQTTGDTATVTLGTTTSSSQNLLIAISDIDVLDIKLYYGTSSNPITSGTDDYPVLQDGGGFSLDIGGLTPSTKYYYVVVDNLNVPIAGGSGSFTTSAATAGRPGSTRVDPTSDPSATGGALPTGSGLGTVSGLNATTSLISVFSSTATLKTTISDITNGGTYHIGFNYGINMSDLSNLGIPTFDTTYQSFFTDLDGLTPSTKYYYSITDPSDPTQIFPGGTGSFTTTDVNGYGGSGTATAPDPSTAGPSSTPTSSMGTISTFTAHTNANGSNISFIAVVNGAATTTDFNYSFVCGLSRTSISDPSSSYTIPMSTVTNPLTLSNTLVLKSSNPRVSPSYPYYCQLYDRNGSSLSSIVTVSYDSGQLGVPYPDNITQTSAAIKLNLATAAGTPPYLVYGTDPAKLNSAKITAVADTTSGNKSFTATITGLKPQSYYYYQMFDNSGDTPQPYGSGTATSSALSFKTADGVAAPPALQVIPGTLPTLNTSKYNGSIVNCGTSEGNADIANRCNFNSLMALVNKFIGILVFIIAPAIAAICMAYGGFLYMTSGGGEGVGQAKGILIGAFTGWLIAFAAWIIIKFIMVQLGYADGFMKFW